MKCKLMYSEVFITHRAQESTCICHPKKFVIERTRGLIYLKLVAKDFFPKIISSSAGENAGDSV